MTSVVFLRGVNVGGNRSFRPKALADDLAGLDVVNIGAAGTFVVRASIPAAKLRAEISRRLPFETEIMICRARDVLALAAADRFADAPAGKDVKRFVCVLAKRPRKPPDLPIVHPEGRDWHVRVIAIEGCCVFSVWRRRGKRLIYPNEVVEKHFGIATTTRNWNTIESICRILEG